MKCCADVQVKEELDDGMDKGWNGRNGILIINYE